MDVVVVLLALVNANGTDGPVQNRNNYSILAAENCAEKQFLLTTIFRRKIVYGGGASIRVEVLPLGLLRMVRHRCKTKE